MGSSEKEEGLSSEGENTKSCSDCKSSPKEDSISYEGLTEGAKKKCCSDCKTTKTPLWRSGPSGPKSLCNACGIRYRKKRPTVAVELKRGKIGKTKGLKIRNPFKVNLMIPLEEQTWYDVKKKQRSPRQWGEVERAALLLMALSCGAIFA